MTSQHSVSYKAFVLTIAVFTVLSTTPVSSAAVSAEPAAAVIGSVTSVGSVQLRGVEIARDATLFVGDVITSRDGYAKLTLKSGHSAELGANTAVTVGEFGSVVQLALASGSVNFSGSGASPIRIDIAPFEVLLTDAGAGTAGLVGAETVVVRSTRGSVLVRNTDSQESFVLAPGQARLFGRSNGVVAQSLGEIASALPAPLPSLPLPAVPPVPQPQAGSGMSSGAWAVIVAAVGGAAGLGAWFAGRSGQVDEGLLSSAQAAAASANAAATSANAAAAASAAAAAAANASLATANASIATLNAHHVASHSHP